MRDESSMVLVAVVVLVGLWVMYSRGAALQPVGAPAAPLSNPDASIFMTPYATASYAAWMTNPTGPQYGGWLNPLEAYRTR